MNGKKKLLVHRLIWFALLVVTVGITIKFWADWADSSALFWFYVIFFLDCLIPSFFICSLFLSCKVYDFKDAEIIVYAGWFHHYIKVDGVLVDEHNTLISFTPIVMSATLKDDTVLQATISLTNRIALKINNQLYLKEKLFKQQNRQVKR